MKMVNQVVFAQFVGNALDMRKCYVKIAIVKRRTSIDELCYYDINYWEKIMKLVKWWFFTNESGSVIETLIIGYSKMRKLF